MVRTEISLFLRNVPGELAKLSSILSSEGVNIDALMIQDASSYVRELFKARGKSIKKLASVSNYNMMKRDSAEFALVRILTSDEDKTLDLLKEHDYVFDTVPVIAIELENKPGVLAEVTDKFGKENININYIYGSVSSSDAKCLFVFAPENIEEASKFF
ncbi:ACT domain-containing protein [bacterium]|nr:ACT domain-containing protein [bacterium]